MDGQQVTLAIQGVAETVLVLEAEESTLHLWLPRRDFRYGLKLLSERHSLQPAPAPVVSPVMWKIKWRILPVDEVHDQPAALAGGHRRNAPWAKVSEKLRERWSLSPSL